MNNRVVFLAVCLVVLFCLAAEGASVGVPGFLPGSRRFTLGLQYTGADGRTFFDRNFEEISVDTELHHYLVSMQYGLSERLAFFLKGGYSDIALFGRELYPHERDIGWGGGLNLILYEDLKVGTSFILGAQYYTFSPEPDGARDLDWNGWDASLRMLIMNHVADPRELIQPFMLTHATFYAGLKYSDAWIDWTDGARSGRLKADGDSVGYLAGIDLVFNDNYIITIEGRFGDESAYTAGMGFKF